MRRFSVEGKVAIVTGAAQGGIGETYARGLAEAGASVVLADINIDGASAAAKRLADDGLAAVAVKVDITSTESVRAMADRARETFGAIDILVNNAALMTEVSRAPLSEYPLDEWNQVLAVNLTGALLCTQAVVPSMRERGGGKIINQSSGGAWASAGAYPVSKLALVGLTVSLARELGPDRIRVNAIAPGLVWSEAGRRMVPQDSPFFEQLKKNVAMQPAGERDDLVGVLLFLASAAGDWVTGQTIDVDGGWVMRT